jgi:4-hydroxybenzoate polyprenyltransferase
MERLSIKPAAANGEDSVAENRTTEKPSVVGAWLRLLRPQQWLKNGFVFAPLLFSLKFREVETVAAVVLAAAAFCLLSSAAYVLNDLCDLRSDRAHPLKRLRPLAAGRIKPPAAIIAAFFCLALGLGFSLVAPVAPDIALGEEKTPPVWVAASAYLALNLAYSFVLKHVVLLDVVTLSAGFVLRVLAGAWAAGIARPTAWLLLCAFLLALFLGFAKRRHELFLLGDGAGNHRRVLENYSPALLDAVLSATAGACVVCYALYALLENKMNPYKTEAMIWTVPFVVFGLFRYMYLAYRRDEGGDPTATLMSDRTLLLTVVLWVCACAYLLSPSRIG